ncbi:MAG: MerR family DNA-binding transcriptional regulator, partial [Aeromicrobium sp.]
MSTTTAQRTYSITEAASLTGLPASTLRYYESIGVIHPIGRGATAAIASTPTTIGDRRSSQGARRFSSQAAAPHRGSSRGDRRAWSRRVHDRHHKVSSPTSSWRTSQPAGTSSRL